MRPPMILPRRSLLAWPAAALVAGCGATMAPLDGTGVTPEARALLAESAAAHGGAALAGIGDIDVAYAGQWRAVVGRLQPDLVDAGFRGQSEERVLLRDGLAGQAYTGPDGHKQVVRQTASGAQGSVRVWFNGVETQDADKRAAAALVADSYMLFLLGPMLLAGPWGTQRSLAMAVAGADTLDQDGQSIPCDILRVRMSPGLGLSASDQLALYIDRRERLLRRVRFTLDGLDSTKGAVADVDTMDHVALHGVRWPTRFHEGLMRPLLLPVHDWRLTGLDVNRGLVAADIDGPAFSARAATPATPFGR